jgi:hypothetical protein
MRQVRFMIFAPDGAGFLSPETDGNATRRDVGSRWIPTRARGLVCDEGPA